MSLLDYSIFFAYLAGVVLLGWIVHGRRRSGGDFFLAGRSMGWLPVGISVMVTAFSAINFVAVPAFVFKSGLWMLVSLPVFFIVAWPVTRVFLPFYHSMELTSAYEYLERRFDVRARLLASGMFILWRCVWMAVVLLACGRILAAVAGMPVAVVMVLAGAVAVAYSAFGGMRAIMWTDVAQFCVLVGGLLLAVGVAAGRYPGGLWGLLDTAFEGQRLRPFLPPTARFLSPDPRIPITLWSGLIGTFVAFLARYAADQVVVQRYFSARSLSDARRGVWLNAAAAVLAIGLLALLGLAVYGHSRATGLMERGLAPPQHLAALLTSMPAGVRGLIAAGILAATMSSIDSGINACSAAWFTDFRNRRDPGPHEEPNEARRGVVFTVAFGTLALGGAFGLLAWIGREQTIFRMVNRVINGLGSPLLALMGLGMFSRRVTPSGIFWGGLVGIACSIFVSLGVENLALHYYAVVNLLLTVGACYVFSLPGMALGHSATQEQLNWTWWHRREGAAHTEGD